MKDYPGPVKLSVELLTPERAADLLRTRHPNRNDRQKIINVYAQSISEDRFPVTGDTIKICPDGRMSDGSHRCYAVIKADRSIWTAFAYNVDVQAVVTHVDGGVKRQPGDILKYHGFKNCSELATTIKIVRSIEVAPSSSRWAEIPREEYPEVAFERPELEQSISVGGRLGKALGTPRSISAAMHHLFGRVSSRDDADEFFEALITGVGLGEFDPIYHLRRRLEVDAQTAPGKERMGPSYRAALFIKAWNAWTVGAEVKNLRWRTSGPAREPFPQINGLPEDGEVAS
ncbi:MAG: hypothetical protein LC679_07525 [Intrasporangiaceae bacterium]|nr:hypothetical protein [Intrasporangiaceae bacterium]